jgi:hypothetical protein
MLEFGNVARLSYEASVITSVYAASDSSEQDAETQETLDYLVDPHARSYSTSATGATEAISRVQEALEQTQTIGDELAGIEEVLDELAKGGLSEERSTYLIQQIEEKVSAISEAVEQTDFDGNVFLGSEGEDLVISIGHGSSITVEAQDLSVSLDDVDLTPAAGLAAFRAAVTAQLKDVSAAEDHLTEQLGRLENATQIIEYSTGSEADGRAEEIDTDAAMAVASLAASSAIEDLSALYGVQEGLDNETAEALLTDRGG